MGDYYNKTRGPLSVTFNDGSVAAVSPKTWLYVTPANEGTSCIQRLVAKGFLVRSTVPRTVVSAPLVEVPTVAVLVPSVVSVAPAVFVSGPPAVEAETLLLEKVEVVSASPKGLGRNR
jgi:hypothetical protein